MALAVKPQGYMDLGVPALVGLDSCEDRRVDFVQVASLVAARSASLVVRLFRSCPVHRLWAGGGDFAPKGVRCLRASFH